MEKVIPSLGETVQVPIALPSVTLTGVAARVAVVLVEQTFWSGPALAGPFGQVKRPPILAELHPHFEVVPMIAVENDLKKPA